VDLKEAASVPRLDHVVQKQPLVAVQQNGTMDYVLLRAQQIKVGYVVVKEFVKLVNAFAYRAFMARIVRKEGVSTRQDKMTPYTASLCGHVQGQLRFK